MAGLTIDGTPAMNVGAYFLEGRAWRIGAQDRSRVLHLGTGGRIGITSNDSAVTTTHIADGLATITLSRAALSNALDIVTKLDVFQAVHRIAGDAAVRAVLLNAEGKNFCVGQDLAEHVEALHADPAAAMETDGIQYNPLVQALSELSVPVVVAFRGACVGGGLGIALAGDIRVVDTGVKFATAFHRYSCGASEGSIIHVGSLHAADDEMVLRHARYVYPAQ